jgi:1,4-dihydroxy-6-naphthoate synthase
MQVALSPCPNDTFLFHGWLTGQVGKDLPPYATFADIEQLNVWALAQKFPLIKLSMGCFAHVQDVYEFLPVGAALGFQCGPKMIALAYFPIEELANKTVAIPGRHTTAHLLLNYFFPQMQKKIFCRYDQITSLLVKGAADCGVIIHESRFTFAKQGFIEIVDLGELWHKQTQSPLPLGGLALLRTTPSTLKCRLIEILQESLTAAHRDPQKVLSFILSHSQEKDPAVVRQHIATYVTAETAHLSCTGQAAITRLLSKGLL